MKLARMDCPGWRIPGFCPGTLHPGFLGLVLALGVLRAVAAAPPENLAPGPLRVSQANSRYFTDNTGTAIYLTGSHTWSNFQDTRLSGAERAFDFDAYLDFLQAHQHNFIRLWRWELPSWKEDDPTLPTLNQSAPHPWRRTGPATARDGQPQFDLDQFNPAYFQRLRERVVKARARGIYVSIMLFEGWAMQYVAGAWQAHPFHPANHIGPLAGPSPDAKGLEIYELKYPAVTAVQEAYVRQVIEALDDLDNVLYEVSNENHAASAGWQSHFVDFIKQEEAARPKQHPVGMSTLYYGGRNETLFQSRADWIAPLTYWPDDAPPGFPVKQQADYREDPPPSDGRKVVLLDTDHLWGVGGSVSWVWKSLTRGYNPLLMDPLPTLTGVKEEPAFRRDGEAVRQAMGDAHRYASKIDLNHATPQPALASTRYCLASAGREYLIYQPRNEPFTADLTPGRYQVEWFDPGPRRTLAGGIVTGGKTSRFNAPFQGAAILYLKRE